MQTFRRRAWGTPGSGHEHRESQGGAGKGRGTGMSFIPLIVVGAIAIGLAVTAILLTRQVARFRVEAEGTRAAPYTAGGLCAASRSMARMLPSRPTSKGSTASRKPTKSSLKKDFG